MGSKHWAIYRRLRRRYIAGYIAFICLVACLLAVALVLLARSVLAVVGLACMALALILCGSWVVRWLIDNTYDSCRAMSELEYEALHERRDACKSDGHLRR